MPRMCELAPQQTQSKVMILDFLRSWADHNWGVKYDRQMCDPTDETKRCDVCTYDLVEWTDKDNGIFSILWYDERSRERSSTFLYQSYAENVSREDIQRCPMEVYKKRMKSAVKKQIDYGKLLEFKDDQGNRKTVRRKFYQFHPLINEEYYFPQDRSMQQVYPEQDANLNGFHSLMTFDESNTPLWNAYSQSQVSDSSSYRTPEMMNNHDSITNSIPLNWEQHSSSSNSLPESNVQDLFEGGILSQELAHGHLEEPSAGILGDESYIGVVEDIRQLLLSQPSTTRRTFEDFEAQEESRCRLDDREVAALLEYFRRCPLPDLSNVKNMKVIISLKDNDSSLFNIQTTPIDDSPNGFRIISQDSNLNVGYEVGKFGPSDFPAKRLPSPNNFTKNDVKKCLKTFEESGMVFLWKRYPSPPSGFSAVLRHVDNLCWRLYCYKICKGYPSNYLQDNQNGSSINSQPIESSVQRSKRLDMCLKTPLRESPFELKDREFIEVFDILKLCASAVIRGYDVSRSISSPETGEKKLSIHIGLKSKTDYDAASLPVKLEFKNTFVGEVFERYYRHTAVVDNSSDTHTQVSNSTRSTRDSTRGWADY